MFHLSKHLKQLIFRLLWRLVADRRLLQSGRCDILREWLIADSLGGASDSHLGLSLGGCATNNFLRGSIAVKKKLLEEGRRGRDLEREDSDLNESTNVGVNSQKEFIYTSNCSLDLR